MTRFINMRTIIITAFFIPILFAFARQQVLLDRQRDEAVALEKAYQTAVTELDEVQAEYDEIDSDEYLEKLAREAGYVSVYDTIFIKK